MRGRGALDLPLHTPPSVSASVQDSASPSSQPLAPLLSFPSSGVSSLIPSSVQYLTSLVRVTGSSKPMQSAPLEPPHRLKNETPLMSSAQWGRLCAQGEAEASAQKER